VGPLPSCKSASELRANTLEDLRSRGYKVLGVCERRGGEAYVGVEMPELAFTLDSVEAFEVNFPVELFKSKFKLVLSHLTDLDYEFCRRANIKPILMLRRKGLRGLIERALNRHEPIYLCRDSVWLPHRLEGLLEILEALRSWYEARSPKKTRGRPSRTTDFEEARVANTLGKSSLAQCTLRTSD